MAKRTTVETTQYTDSLEDEFCEVWSPAGPFDPMGRTVYCDGSCC